MMRTYYVEVWRRFPPRSLLTVLEVQATCDKDAQEIARDACDWRNEVTGELTREGCTRTFWIP